MRSTTHEISSGTLVSFSERSALRPGYFFVERQVRRNIKVSMNKALDCLLSWYYTQLCRYLASPKGMLPVPKLSKLHAIQTRFGSGSQDLNPILVQDPRRIPDQAVQSATLSEIMILESCLISGEVRRRAEIPEGIMLHSSSEERRVRLVAGVHTSSPRCSVREQPTDISQWKALGSNQISMLFLHMTFIMSIGEGRGKKSSIFGTLILNICKNLFD